MASLSSIAPAYSHSQKFHVGQGYQKFTGRTIHTGLKLTKEVTVDPSFRFTALFCDTLLEVQRQLNLSVGLSGTTAAYDVSASLGATYNTSSKTSQIAGYYLLEFSWIKKSEEATEIDPGAAEIAKIIKMGPDDIQKFYENFGDAFISRVDYGQKLIAIVEVNAKATSQITQLAANLGLSFTIPFKVTEKEMSAEEKKATVSEPTVPQTFSSHTGDATKKDSPLMQAAKEGNFKKVHDRLLAGDSPSETDSMGLTPLLHALSMLHDDVACDIIGTPSRKSHIFICDSSNQSALIYAARYTQENTFFQIMNTLDQDVIDAVSKLEENERRKCLNLKDMQEYLDIQDFNEGYAALHWAAENSDEQMVESLCQLGANFDLQTTYGDTALHLAARNGDIATADTLVAYEAKIDLANDEEKTALELIIEKGLYATLLTILTTEGLTIDLQKAHAWAKQYKQNELEQLLSSFAK